ncbi:class I SAM-dependent methyltransferase [Patulibacter sp. S7RM1-6]
MPDAPDLVPDRLEIAGVALDVLRPRDPEALLDEEAFEHEEYLPYWAELWPSAPVLAARLAERGDLAGLRILELGCGLALPSLLAAARGADVTATDWAPDALELLRRNAARNAVTLAIRPLDWFADAPEPDGPWPLVIAADVLYEARNAGPLLRALERTVAPGGEAWVADPGRRPAEGFWALARQGWEVDAQPRRDGERATVHVLRRRG